MVRLDRYVELDDAKAEPSAPSDQSGDRRQHQGFLLADAQFDDLIKDLDLPLLDGREAKFRMQLNDPREVILQDRLQRAQLPSRAEVHKALAEVRKQTRVFLECAATIGPRDWRAEARAIEPEGPLNVFCAIPEALYGFASHARFEAKHCDALSLQLVAFAEAADRLA
jgi:hypothetical protein